MNEENLTDETRQKLKALSKTFLRLHKTLLEAARLDYETKNGKVQSVNHYFQLVLDDPHFAWLRKMSSLVALIDEAVSVRRPTTEIEARALLAGAKRLLDFKDPDEDFNDKLQTALQKNADAVLIYNEVLSLVN